MSNKISRPGDSIEIEKGFTKEIKNFILMLDPFDSNKINLSDVIKLFSS